MMKRIVSHSGTALLLGMFILALSSCGEKPAPLAGSMASHEPTKILPVGVPAPQFTLQDETGNSVRLADYFGKRDVVLVFYPGDNTPGCTKQLCGIRDDWSKFKAKNVAVFGVNPADAASHMSFLKKFTFPFPLLVDNGQKVAGEYGCKGTNYLQRTVYGIDKHGFIVFAQRGMPTTEQILSAFPSS